MRNLFLSVLLALVPTIVFSQSPSHTHNTQDGNCILQTGSLVNSATPFTTSVDINCAELQALKVTAELASDPGTDDFGNDYAAGHVLFTLPSGEVWAHVPSTPFDPSTLQAQIDQNEADIAAFDDTNGVLSGTVTNPADGAYDGYTLQADHVEDGVTTSVTVSVPHSSTGNEGLAQRATQADVDAATDFQEFITPFTHHKFHYTAGSISTASVTLGNFVWTSTAPCQVIPAGKDGNYSIDSHALVVLGASANGTFPSGVSVGPYDNGIWSRITVNGSEVFRGPYNRRLVSYTTGPGGVSNGNFSDSVSFGLTLNAGDTACVQTRWGTAGGPATTVDPNPAVMAYQRFFLTRNNAN